MRFNLLKKAIAFLPKPPLKLIDSALIDDVFEAEWRRHHDVISSLLQKTSALVESLPEHERSLPGDLQFLQSGHYKTMLKRYVFAGAFFCRNKRVLDSCCGLGWGAFLLAQYARSVCAFDREAQAVAFCRQTWKTTNVTWLQADALHRDTAVSKQQFDVACAMETIEHFNKEDGARYIAGLADSLHTDGVLIGTSAFPPDRKRADELCARNPYHAYIFTDQELGLILNTCFSKFVIIDNWMFIARK